jgi:hypothetical protein
MENSSDSDLLEVRTIQRGNYMQAVTSQIANQIVNEKVILQVKLR